MLDGMRKAAQGVIGRIVMGIVMSLIIVSFVIWGVGDMLHGFTSNTVATVGSSSITSQQFETEFQNTLYQVQQRTRQPLTAQQARAFGLDGQVLGRLIADAALDERARSLGLAISDQTIAEAARSDSQLAGPDGKFDRTKFDQALRQSGLTERAFFAQQRKIYLRQQFTYSLLDGFDAPKVLTDALASAKNQTRAIDYFTLAPSAAGDIPAPAPEALKAWFGERKADYRAPEYRGLDLVEVTPASLAKPDAVSDADAKATFEKEKDVKYVTPEKRKLQQIVFPSEAEANEAEAKIKGGASFDDIAKARNVGPTDLDLGEVAKAGFFDPAIAEAAFSLPENGVSGAIKGQFGPVIVRVQSIVPGAAKKYEDVAAEIKRDIASARAFNEVQTIHDKIEDARVSGKTLGESAKAAGVEARAIPAVDQRGFDPQGADVPLPDKTALLQAAFASDIGGDDAALNTKDKGYLWFSVQKVDPAHDRSFDDVKAKVEADWRGEQTEKKLAEKAADLVKQINAGADPAELAKAANVELKQAKDIRRAGGAGLAANVVAAVFAVGPDKAGSTAIDDDRLVFKVTADAMAPADAADPGVKMAASRETDALRAGVIDEFLTALKRQLGVRINPGALQSVEGG